MDKKRCFTCQGSGKVMGGGMIFKSCSECDDGYVVDRYGEAVAKIKKQSGLDDEGAKKLLDDEMGKIKKRGRKRHVNAAE